MESSLKYSIIVPIYNQFDHWLEQVAVFNRIGDRRKDFEVLFLDDGSDTDYTRIIRLLDRHNNFKVHRFLHDGFGCTKMKNRGMKLAKGEWLIINDGDNILEDDILEAYDMHATDKKMLYFGPRLVKGHMSKKYGCIPPLSYAAFSGANLCFAKGAMEEWADEKIFNEYGLDDYYFIVKWLQKYGMAIFVVDAISYRKEGVNKKRKVPPLRLYDLIKAEEKKLPKDLRVLAK